VAPSTFAFVGNCRYNTSMKIALDIDGVITEYPEVFHQLSHALIKSNEIYVITNRDPDSVEEIKTELAAYGIRWDHLIITAKKAEAIMKFGVQMVYEDTDEYFLELPPSVCVCKVREPGNFNYQTKKWIYGKKTGENIDK
jgi:uncharacterized HAD superfamily protein